MKFSLRVLFIFILISPLYPRNDGEPVHILYLNSYDSRMSWYKDILQGIEDVLEPDQSNIILHLEDMDSKRFHTEEYFRVYYEFMAQKYRDYRFSMIFCSDNNAFEFIRRHHKELYPGIPIVFCGVNDFEASMLDGHEEITGIEELFSARTTVELALLLHPETEEIYIINDYLVTGRAWQKVIEAELEPLGDRVRLRYSENLPMEELQRTISSLGENSIVLLGVYYSDRDGDLLTYETTGKAIAEASHVPLYCLLGFNIMDGVMGGDVISGYSQGLNMALIGKKILEGASPSDFPVASRKYNELIINYGELERFGIAESMLPENSTIINRPYSLYEDYFHEIWISITAFLLLTLTVIALIVTVLKKRQAEDSLRELVEASWEGIVIHDHGNLVNCNRVFLSMFQLRDEDLLDLHLIQRVFTSESLAVIMQKIEQGETEPYEVTGVRSDGSRFPVEIRIRIIEQKGRELRLAALRDLTEQKKLEEKIQQSQKLQAIGTLAGGIAHDFNNILSGVLGYADLGLMSTQEDSTPHNYFSQILKAGKRARDLVKQILTFSRQSVKETRSVVLAELIEETLELLRATLPATIRIHSELDRTLCIPGDPAQLQQIVMNLCTNAGLALREDGGDLELILNAETVDDVTSPQLDLSPGQYARLVVRDNGCGMNEEVRSRIFDPFYTTREQGKGTGMGLSVVHGIITQMAGAVSVDSSPGEGTSFNVFLPLCADTIRKDSLRSDLRVTGGRERILFVDDEAIQRDIGREIMEYLGYGVTICGDSTEALELFRSHPAAFDLLISDVTMPDMTGDVLVEKVRSIRPGLPVLLCTGYSDRMSFDKLESIGPIRIVMKPLLLQELAVNIRAVLDGRD